MSKRRSNQSTQTTKESEMATQPTTDENQVEDTQAEPQEVDTTPQEEVVAPLEATEDQPADEILEESDESQKQAPESEEEPASEVIEPQEEVAQEEPAPKEEVQPSPKAAALSFADMSLEDYLEHVTGTKGDQSQPLRLVKSLMNSYMAEMGPSVPASSQTHIANVRRLLSIYRQVLTLSETDFDPGMEMLMYYARKYKASTFSTSGLYRGFNNVSLSAEDSGLYTLLSHVIVQTAEPARRQVNFNRLDHRKISSAMPTADAAAKFLAFFTK